MPNMKDLSLITFAGEGHKENNKIGCHLKNVGKSDLIFGKPMYICARYETPVIRPVIRRARRS